MISEAKSCNKSLFCNTSYFFYFVILHIIWIAHNRKLKTFAFTHSFLWINLMCGTRHCWYYCLIYIYIYIYIWKLLYRFTDIYIYIYIYVHIYIYILIYSVCVCLCVCVCVCVCVFVCICVCVCVRLLKSQQSRMSIIYV